MYPSVYGVLQTVLMLCLLLSVPVAVAAPNDEADTSFEHGVEAFRAGNYEQALQAFERARILGLDSTKLQYNLGVTYYHLHRYTEARQVFESLLPIEAVAARAHYNLGLVALRQQLDDEAYAHFSLVARTTGDPRLRELAEQQLAAFVPVVRSKRFSGFVDAGGGYDDNVTLVPDSAVVATSGQEDSFAELMGGMVGQLTGTSESGLRFKASAYWINYSDLDAFDQVSLRGGLAWRERYRGWRTEVAGYADLIYLDNEPFEQAGTLSLQGIRKLGEDAFLRLRVRSGYIDAEGEFTALTGWRNQLLGEVRVAPGAVDWRLGYELENNDREDQKSGAEYISLSPVQHRFFARADWDVHKDTVISVSGDYRYSRYRDPNRSGQGAGMATETREDQGWRASAGVDYYLTNVWIVTGEYQYIRNDSNLDNYDYTSNRFMVRLERTF